MESEQLHKVLRQAQHHDVQGAPVSVYSLMAQGYDAAHVDVLTSYVHETMHIVQGRPESQPIINTGF